MAKGNNPDRWEKLLAALDEKLQLGLLDHVRKVASYHFEEDVLYLEPASAEESQYLGRDFVLQQLLLLVQDTVRVKEIKLSTTRSSDC